MTTTVIHIEDTAPDRMKLDELSLGVAASIRGVAHRSVRRWTREQHVDSEQANATNSFPIDALADCIMSPCWCDPVATRA